MAFISVTRLRIRSFRYLPAFVWRTWLSLRQTERAPGFLGGKLLPERKNVFWTLTAWEDGAAMNSFRTSGAHNRAMPRLLNWCDEASVVHWNQDSPELPNWFEAHRRMLGEGRPSKVKHPSPAHLANRIPVPKPGPAERIFTPAKNN